MKTRIGIYVDKPWQFKMYFELFKELLPDATIIVRNQPTMEAVIESDTHRVYIYGYAPTAIRGHKHDAIINLIQDKDFVNMCLIPVLNCSKFLKERYNEG